MKTCYDTMHLITSSITKTIVILAFLFFLTVPDAMAGNITIRIKNTDSASHAFCIQYYRSGAWTDLFAANLSEAGGVNPTYSSPFSLSGGDKVRVKWGDYQQFGASCSSGSKPYYAMLDDSGLTEYTVVGSGDQTTPWLEMVSVSLSPTSRTIPEGQSDTLTVTRTGSTSYALSAYFTTTGTFELSPSRDGYLYYAPTFYDLAWSPFTISSGNSSVDIVFLVFADGTGELQETCTITLSTASNFILGADHACTVTVPQN